MSKIVIIVDYDGHKINYEFTFDIDENVAIISMAREEGFFTARRFEIVVAKHSEWYYLIFPDVSDASPGISNICDFDFVYDHVYDADYAYYDVEAISLAIVHLGAYGF